METKRSACPLDCPDLCGLDVTVDGDRIVRVDGDRRGPLTDGFICGKVRKIAEHVHGDDRVLHPLVRVGAKGDDTWRRASWDEALDLVAGRIAEIRARAGGQAILPYHYGGSNGWLTEGALATRMFRRLRASILDRTISGEWETVHFGYPAEFDELLVLKGSIAIDGVSLTLAKVEPGQLAVMLIPHTLAHTTLGSKAIGDRVNLEFDLLAKHVQKLFRNLTVTV